MVPFYPVKGLFSDNSDNLLLPEYRILQFATDISGREKAWIFAG